MQNEMIGVICFIIMFGLLAFRMWVGLAMAFAGFIGLYMLRGFDQAWKILYSSTFNNIATYALTVIPMFILMGCVISETSIGSSLYKCMHKWLGHLKGGLAYATLAATGFLAAITGSQLTGAVVMSRIAFPEMEKLNYKDELSTGCIVSASPLGILIPPSTAFVVYGLLTELPIGKLFIAGIIPGLLTILIFFGVIYLMCKIDKKMGPASSEKYKFVERLKSSTYVIPVLIVFIVVIFGIYAGIFTATEAGAIGAGASIVVALLFRDLTWKKFVKSLKETANIMGMIILMMTGTYIFSTAIAYSGLTRYLGHFVTSMNIPQSSVIIAIIIMYLVLGMFLPEFPMMMLTVPIIYPIIVQLGIDGIWFGVLVVVLMAVCMMTPPLGMLVFVMSGFVGRPVGVIYKGVFPFVLGEIVLIVLLTVFPSIATWLPSSM